VNREKPPKLGTNHVLPAFHCAFQDPSDPVGGCSGVERIERDNVGSQAVKRFPVNFKMPLVAWGDPAFFDIPLGVWRLNKLDRAEPSCGDKVDEVNRRP
jgi:hypothetical protein